MKRHVLLISLLGLLPVLAMFFAPKVGAGNTSGPLVTQNVKNIDAGLAQIKKLSDGREFVTLQDEVCKLGGQWQQMKDGLLVRHLSNSPSALDFGRAVNDLGAAATSRDTTALKTALGRSNSAFKKLKEELQQTVTVDTGRIVASAGGIILLGVVLVVVSVQLSNKPGIKQ